MTLEPIGGLLDDVKPRPRRRQTPDEALTERDELILDLVHVGIGLRKAQNLVDLYPAEVIERQLKWLPSRAARRPASLLIAAIENNYDPPVYAKQ
jgi:hypothetical protein